MHPGGLRDAAYRGLDQMPQLLTHHAPSEVTVAQSRVCSNDICRYHSRSSPQQSRKSCIDEGNQCWHSGEHGIALLFSSSFRTAPEQETQAYFPRMVRCSSRCKLDSSEIEESLCGYVCSEVLRRLFDVGVVKI